jgi:hypothetical protein
VAFELACKVKKGISNFVVIFSNISSKECGRKVANLKHFGDYFLAFNVFGSSMFEK